MMVTGNILCSVSPIPTSGDHFPPPTSFYEYDSAANSFTSVSGPTGPTEPGSCYGTIMLDLPDGSVLFSHFSAQLYVYQPTGSPLAAGKPTISSLTQNGDGSYHLVGTLFNGISEGASYGDDFQMNSNYPLVRLSDGGGNVYYARTYNWSSTGVQTGAAPVTTEFVLPAALPPGQYSLVVVANGIPSDPTPLVPLMAAFCGGDSSDPNVSTFCPCFNFGQLGHGCANSSNANGALLTATGTPSPDTIVLTSAGEPSAALSVFLQGTTNASAGIAYGDGVRCASGNLKRLYTKNAVAGSVSAPQGVEPSITVRSAAVGDVIPPGGTRYYQVFYRDPNAGFCPSETYNISNGYSIQWP
jgi:hypothetical protein